LFLPLFLLRFQLKIVSGSTGSLLVAGYWLRNYCFYRASSHRLLNWGSAYNGTNFLIYSFLLMTTIVFTDPGIKPLTINIPSAVIADYFSKLRTEQFRYPSSTGHSFFPL